MMSFNYKLSKCEVAKPGKGQFAGIYYYLFLYHTVDNLTLQRGWNRIILILSILVLIVSLSVKKMLPAFWKQYNIKICLHINQMFLLLEGCCVCNPTCGGRALLACGHLLIPTDSLTCSARLTWTTCTSSWPPAPNPLRLLAAPLLIHMEKKKKTPWPRVTPCALNDVNPIDRKSVV